MGAERRLSEGRSFFAKLTESERGPLFAQLERVQLRARQRLETAAHPDKHVFFLTGGFAFVVGPRDGIGLTVVGPEAVIGACFESGGDGGGDFETQVGCDAEAYRLPVETFRQLFELSEPFRARVMRYGYAFARQIARTAIINARHTLNERIARWLLIIDDRNGMRPFHITHVQLAALLCVRRPGVTVAINSFEREGLVCSERGVVEIRDRVGLMRRANGAYDEHEDAERLVLR